KVSLRSLPVAAIADAGIRPISASRRCSILPPAFTEQDGGSLDCFLARPALSAGGLLLWLLERHGVAVATHRREELAGGLGSWLGSRVHGSRCFYLLMTVLNLWEYDAAAGVGGRTEGQVAFGAGGAFQCGLGLLLTREGVSVV
ncbi:MAG: hypothetical protein ACPIOQ_59435, partial [Promethearchaeia archaeon]